MANTIVLDVTKYTNYILIGDKHELENDKWRPRKDRHLRVFRLSRTPGQPPGSVRTGSILTRHQVDRRVLASSVDFDVEFKPVALVELVHA